MRDRKAVAFTRLYGFCAAKFSKTATNFVLRPWQTARRKAVMSFLTRLGNGHRELLFDRSRCFNFRRDSAQVFAKKRAGRNVSAPTKRLTASRSSVSAIKIVRRRRNLFARRRLSVAQKESLAVPFGKIIEIGRFLGSFAVNALQI